MNTRIIDEKPLKGAFSISKKPKFNIDDWYYSKYQKKVEDYFNERMGFHSSLIRLYNQAQYSIFNKINTESTFLAIDNYILEEKYVFAHYGLDYIGKNYIQSQVEKTRSIQYKLKERYNIDLLVVFTPSKISYCNDKIPDNYNQFISDSTNYKTLRTEIIQHKINFIDFNKWFTIIKDTSSFELFPVHGIHWGTYAAMLATDSFFSYISEDNRYTIPNMKITKTILSDSIAKRDNDITSSLNLIYPPKYKKSVLPIINIDNIDDKNLKLLAIGDSYFSSIFTKGILNKFCEDYEFFYYNKVRRKNNKEQNIVEGSYLDKIVKYNFIVLFNTELNYWNYGNGFVELLYHELMPLSDDKKREELYNFYYEYCNIDSVNAKEKSRNIVRNIRADFNHYKKARINLRKTRELNSINQKNKLINRARAKGISIEEMAFRQARYMINTNPITKIINTRIDSDEEINKVINNIQQNSNWLEKVTEQANNRNISVDSMLIRAANHVIRNRKKK